MSNGKYKAPTIYCQFNYDPAVLSDIATVPVTKEYSISMTVQSQAEDADINVLMKRFGLLGVMPQSPRVPTYGDFSEVTDYQSALNAVLTAEDSFAMLTAEVRARFENDPQKLLEFVSSPNNYDEGVKLGLFSKKVESIVSPKVAEVATNQEKESVE